MLKAARDLGKAFAIAVLPALSTLALAPSPAAAQLSINITVNLAPPALPVYAQPPLPALGGYIWVPGYWAWDPDFGDYYWVPGAWVAPPRVGLLWTPGYWEWRDGVYAFHEGYWGRTVGFYGGVSYGFGYTGLGFAGGEWRGDRYFYNSSVTNVANVHITNVYNKTVIINNNSARASFNGGPNGANARPTPEQIVEAKATHLPPTGAQVQHLGLAKSDPKARFSANQGKPAAGAVEKPVGESPIVEKPTSPAGTLEKPTEAVGAKDKAAPAPANIGASKAAERPATLRPTPGEHAVKPEAGERQPEGAKPEAHPLAKPEKIELKPKPVLARPEAHARPAPPPAANAPRPAPPHPVAAHPAPHPAPHPAACHEPHCPK